MTGIAPADPAADLAASARPLMEHLIELRRRLLWSFAAMLVGTIFCFFFSKQIYGFLVRPLAGAMGSDQHELIYTGLAEGFITYIKVAFFAGVFLTFPILAMQIWKFIAPGLYEKERRAFRPFLFATPALFFLGGAFVYFLVLPVACHFFLSNQTSSGQTTLPIRFEGRVSEYLDFVMMFIFAFGLCFQLPVVLTLAGRAGLIDSALLKEKRRYAIVAIFVVSAILTPPDVMSQLILALPLLGLYEISVILVRRNERTSAKTKDQAANAV